MNKHLGRPTWWCHQVEVEQGCLQQTRRLALCPCSWCVPRAEGYGIAGSRRKQDQALFRSIFLSGGVEWRVLLTLSHMVVNCKYQLGPPSSSFPLCYTKKKCYLTWGFIKPTKEWQRTEPTLWWIVCNLVRNKCVSIVILCKNKPSIMLILTLFLFFPSFELWKIFRLRSVLVLARLHSVLLLCHYVIY